MTSGVWARLEADPSCPLKEGPSSRAPRVGRGWASRFRYRCSPGLSQGASCPGVPGESSRRDE
eukprot:6471985-Pyramimonas_sp.AAC.1